MIDNQSPFPNSCGAGRLFNLFLSEGYSLKRVYDIYKTKASKIETINLSEYHEAKSMVTSRDIWGTKEIILLAGGGDDFAISAIHTSRTSESFDIILGFANQNLEEMNVDQGQRIFKFPNPLTDITQNGTPIFSEVYVAFIQENIQKYSVSIMIVPFGYIKSQFVSNFINKSMF